MIEIIKESKIRIREEEQKIRAQIIEYLKVCDYTIQSNLFQVIDIKDLDDLPKIYYGAGFY